MCYCCRCNIKMQCFFRVRQKLANTVAAFNQFWRFSKNCSNEIKTELENLCLFYNKIIRNINWHCGNGESCQYLNMEKTNFPKLSIAFHLNIQNCVVHLVKRFFFVERLAVFRMDKNFIFTLFAYYFRLEMSQSTESIRNEQKQFKPKNTICKQSLE